MRIWNPDTRTWGEPPPPPPQCQEGTLAVTPEELADMPDWRPVEHGWDSPDLITVECARPGVVTCSFCGAFTCGDHDYHDEGECVG